jgi:serine phosphatase RsbU (regulator of sigma subunit)
MNNFRHTICLSSLMLLFACSEEPPPISVAEFMEQPRLLEATMVRCAQNRSESRYDVECINARDAVNRMEAAQEKTRREELEQQSERKRQALRRTQQAAAEARRRTQEAQRLREEQEYLGIFDGSDRGSDATGSVGPELNTDSSSNAPTLSVEAPPAPAEAEALPEAEPSGPETDLGAIREELRRRQETNNEPR